MDYHFEKATPANTAKTGRLKTKMKLTAGTIKQVWIFHPPGCMGLAYATIREGKHQLYPTNPEGAYHSDGEPATFPDNYELKAPAILWLETWNLDDTYQHTVYVRITIIREKPDPLLVILQDILTIIKRMMGIR